MKIKERCAPVTLPLVECCSLNVGSTNLGGSAYINIPEDVEYCVSQLLEHHRIPEAETFEIGHTHYMSQLMKKFPFAKPVLFSIVLGHQGEAPATAKALAAMVDFIPPEGVWGITHAHRQDFGIIAAALDFGARTVRVGFVDSDYLDENTRVKTNAPLVKATADLIHSMNKEVMTPDEVRKFLNISR